MDPKIVEADESYQPAHAGINSHKLFGVMSGVRGDDGQKLAGTRGTTTK